MNPSPNFAPLVSEDDCSLPPSVTRLFGGAAPPLGAAPLPGGPTPLSVPSPCSAPLLHDGAQLVSEVPFLGATLGLVEQLRDFVARAKRDTFDRVTSARCGSIGAHVRHALDHIEALARSGSQRASDGCCEVDYQYRIRDTLAEHCPEAALARIDLVRERLHAVAHHHANSSVVVRQVVGDDEPPEAVNLVSTWQREWAFVFSHTLHHMAVLSLLAASHGVDVPEDFGVAPSTLRARRDERSRRSL